MDMKLLASHVRLRSPSPQSNARSSRWFSSRWQLRGCEIVGVFFWFEWDELPLFGTMDATAEQRERSTEAPLRGSASLLPPSLSLERICFSLCDQTS